MNTTACPGVYANYTTQPGILFVLMHIENLVDNLPRRFEAVLITQHEARGAEYPNEDANGNPE